jgi:shikimate 5-dehydrogenase
MFLERKNAVIYGGGGTIGGAVARAFAREGATVHLAGRTPAKLEQVAEQVRQHGGTEGRDALVESLVGTTLLGRGATLEDVGNVAAFVASDGARTITASAINITCGAIIT